MLHAVHYEYLYVVGASYNGQKHFILFGCVTDEKAS